MLDPKEIDIEIARLEYGESSYPAYAKLANLYTIRNQMQKREAKDYEQSYSAAPANYALTTDLYGDSDFLRAIEGKDPRDAWDIMDDLMDTLSVVAPRVHASVMAKLREI